MIELTNEQWQRCAESEEEADKVIKENYNGTNVYLNGEEYTIPHFSEMYGWQHFHISAKELHRLALEKILGGVN